MKRARKGEGRSISMTISFWLDKSDSGIIHLRGEGTPASLLSTVSATSEHERGHPHLFKQLAKQLRAAGAPAPEVGPPNTK